jgi:hypothetical protein
MSNGGRDPVIHRMMRGRLANVNLTELDEARGIASNQPWARLKQSSALVGDVAARDYIRSQYRGRAHQMVMRRANCVPVCGSSHRTGPASIASSVCSSNPRSEMHAAAREHFIIELTQRSIERAGLAKALRPNQRRA